ncbi:MAG: DUF5667 domain-containing protein [Nocardioides sp.]|uniref:DUF5667 domain-containing protein n=1 Tax=Nocardioides sp. TaxID=35761 RepID=UPI0032638DC8
MTGPFSTRRRAEEFDAAISRPLTEQDAKDFAALLAVVRDLRAIPQPEPRSDFVSDLRVRLMAEADTALLPQATRPLTDTEQRLVLPVRPSRRDRRLAVALGAAAIVGATSSMAMAAQTALPGESLYPVKRAIEQAQNQFARGDTATGQALLANARDRLDEVRELTERGNPASISAVDSTLETFSDQADDASDALLAAYAETGDEALITELHEFTGSSMDRLSELEWVVPESARGSLVSAGQRLADIDRRASVTCPACGGTVTSIPPNLLSAGNLATSVTTVIVAASQNPSLLQPVKPAREPTTPDPVSGQETDGVEVPDLQVPTPTPTATASPTPTPTKVDGKLPVNDVTKLLTGDLSTAVDGVPVADQLLTDVGTTLNGTVDGVQGTLDGVTDPLLP